MHLSSELLAAGASSLRLNGSHMSADDLRAAISYVRSAVDSCPIVLDLQGSKMRLGQLPPRPVHPNQQVVFCLKPDCDAQIPIPHRELFDSARSGDTISIDDGRLRFLVTQQADQQLVTRCLEAGVVKARKGVNLIEHPVDFSDLTDADAAQLQVGLEFENVAFAVSFMKDGREASWVRRRAAGRVVVGKIERREAVSNIDAIASATDQVWVCRGDLGSQLGFVQLAQWVGEFRADRIHTPVLLAGQVLEHLTEHGQPTRSEVCHLFDILRRGYCGIVLSDETAIGQDPVRAVRIASQLLGSLSAEA